MTDVVDGIPLFQSISPEQLGSINLVLACLSAGPRDKEPTVRALAHAIWGERRLC